MTAVAAEPVTLTYLRYKIVLLDERHLTITDPDGQRLIAGARMSIREARNFIRGYRYEARLEQLAAERKAA